MTVVDLALHRSLEGELAPTICSAHALLAGAQTKTKTRPKEARNEFWRAERGRADSFGRPQPRRVCCDTFHTFMESVTLRQPRQTTGSDLCYQQHRAMSTRCLSVYQPLQFQHTRFDTWIVSGLLVVLFVVVFETPSVVMIVVMTTTTSTSTTTTTTKISNFNNKPSNCVVFCHESVANGVRSTTGHFLLRQT